MALFQRFLNTLVTKLYLVQLFNTVFASGEYPEAWTKAVIYPLHKKGSFHEPDNYRGICTPTSGISVMEFVVC